MFWKRSKKTAIHVMEPQAHVLSPSVVGSPLRRGMWVVFGGNTGILVRAKELGIGEVHLVNAAGETVEVVDAPLDSLRQARWDEIPEPRRPEREMAAAMGYRT